MKIPDCDTTEVCVNKQGSFTCNCKNGYRPNLMPASLDPNQVMTACIKTDCDPGWERKNEDSDDCTDIDECQIVCNGTNHSCENTIGSFECTCGDGYILVEGECEDFDECHESKFTGATLCPGENNVCRNTEGSFECGCLDGWDSRNSTDNGLVCIAPACAEGFERLPNSNPFDNCTDIDDCNRDESLCSGENQFCNNLEGSYECVCNIGYTDLLINNTASQIDLTCIDVDECLDRSSCKDSNTICENNIGSYTCRCAKGYKEDVDSGSCVNVNECEVIANLCGEARNLCSDTDGGYECFCSHGYRAISYSDQEIPETCIDIDECLEKPLEEICHPTELCINSVGNYECICPKGWERIKEPESIDEDTEIDVALDLEYSDGSDNLEGSGINNQGLTKINKISAGCKKTEIPCEPGFVRQNYTDICIDINECEENTHDCSVDQICENEEGSFKCSKKYCALGYSLDQEGNCQDINECGSLESPCKETNSKCINTLGSYTCEDIQLPATTEPPHAKSMAPIQKFCPEGFMLNRKSNKCIDIDECHTPGKRYGEGICHEKDLCVNYRGDYKCYPRISPYSIKTSIDYTDAKKPKECFFCSHICNFPDFSHHMKFTCSCYPGWKLSRDKFSCMKDKKARQLKYRKCSNLGDSKISIKYEDKCYIKFTKRLTYDRAISKCQDIGGRLAQIDNRRLLWVLERESFFQPFWVDTIDPNAFEVALIEHKVNVDSSDKLRRSKRSSRIIGYGKGLNEFVYFIMRLRDHLENSVLTPCSPEKFTLSTPPVTIDRYRKYTSFTELK